MFLRAHPTDRGIFAATLALAAAATVALLASGYTKSTGRLLSDSPAVIDGAQATTARASSAPSPAHHKRYVPAPVASPTLDDQRGFALYLLIEAARPPPLFAH